MANVTAMSLALERVRDALRPRLSTISPPGRSRRRSSNWRSGEYETPIPWRRWFWRSCSRD